MAGQQVPVGTPNVRGAESKGIRGTCVHRAVAPRRFASSPGPQLFHVYLLRCSDGTFYTGSCKNLKDRLATHNRGKGPTWTRKPLPVELVHSESFLTRDSAIAREKQLKRWSHVKKSALAAGDTQRLRALSKRRR